MRGAVVCFTWHQKGVGGRKLNTLVGGSGQLPEGAFRNSASSLLPSGHVSESLLQMETRRIAVAASPLRVSRVPVDPAVAGRGGRFAIAVGTAPAGRVATGTLGTLGGVAGGRPSGRGGETEDAEARGIMRGNLNQGISTLHAPHRAGLHIYCSGFRQGAGPTSAVAEAPAQRARRSSAAFSCAGGR